MHASNLKFIQDIDALTDRYIGSGLVIADKDRDFKRADAAACYDRLVDNEIGAPIKKGTEPEKN